MQNRGKISKNDFIYAIENLKIKMASSDLNLIFSYLDKNGDNYVTYQEFCGLCEEKRRNIDPFEFHNIREELKRNYEKSLER